MRYDKETLALIQQALGMYDDAMVEDCYTQFVFNRCEEMSTEQLVGEISKMLQDQQKKYRKEVDLHQYQLREHLLKERFEQVDAKEVYRFAFPEDSLQVCDELDDSTGVGNAIRLDLVQQWETTDGFKHSNQYAIQSIVTEDLINLYVYPKKVSRKNVIMSNTNLNSYFGSRRLTSRIDRIHGLIVEVDNVAKEGQIKRFIDKITVGQVPKPNYVVNSGHGFHAYYVFDNPIMFHGRSFEVYPVMTNILNAIKDMLWTADVTNSKPEKLDLNKAYTIIGTPNRKNTDLIATAYRVYEHKYSLAELRRFIDKPLDDMDYDITFAPRRKCSKYEAAKQFPLWAVQRFPELFSDDEREQLLQEVSARNATSRRSITENRKYTACNMRIYNWFYRLVSNPENIRHGNRYHCMVALAIYGVKCAVSKDKVEEDLQGLLELYNSIEADHEDNRFLLGAADIKNALQVYKNEMTNLYTFKWIMDFTGINYSPVTKRRNKPLKQADHLAYAREQRDILYPNGSWRGNSSGETKQKIVDFIIENKDADIKMCIEQSGCSQSSVYKYWKMCRKELGLDFGNREASADMIKQFRIEHPTATKSQCIKELGLSKPTVYKHWC